MPEALRWSAILSGDAQGCRVIRDLLRGSASFSGRTAAFRVSRAALRPPAGVAGDHEATRAPPGRSSRHGRKKAPGFSVVQKVKRSPEALCREEPNWSRAMPKAALHRL